MSDMAERPAAELEIRLVHHQLDGVSGATPRRASHRQNHTFIEW